MPSANWCFPQSLILTAQIMINVGDLKPARAMSDSIQLDKDSVLMLRNLLNHHRINDSRLQEGGTQDNVDGYIVLLDSEDRPEGKVYVQVKHMTYPPKDGKAFYDIPGELLGYAGRFNAVDVILFITCDTDNNTFYWKCIDDSFIAECLKKGSQGTYRYYFKENEMATATTVDGTLSQWRCLYQSKMDSIDEERKALNGFMSLQKRVFNQTPSVFYGVEGSFVKRAEIDTLYNWIVSPLAQGESPLKLLIGEAGVGKTVVIKSLIERLDKDGIKTLSIKADRSNVTDNTYGPLTLQTLQSSIDLLSSQQDLVILIIDQIDALSQSLSNDRDKLNLLLDAISSLKIESSKPVRIIVSCRKYDLIYDSSLRSLGFDNALELGKMSDVDIQSVLNKLSPGLYERLNQHTKALLQKAQLLDMFCRLYAGGHRHTKYQSEIALFDELWLHLTNDHPQSITSSDVEGFLFSIAKTIKDSETLSPYWSPSSKEYPIMQFLSSEGILRTEGGQVSFFHQSFFDYTSARQYMQSGRSFVSDIENQFQGLEIRSNVKLILDFMRSHSESKYKDVLFNLLHSPRVRPHIKLIALSIVASANDYSAFERKLVRETYLTDHQLYAAFLNGTSAEWFPAQYSLLLKSACDLSTEHVLFNSIAFFLYRNASTHSAEVVAFVNSIDDVKARSDLARYLLRGDLDYREETVKALYRSTVASKVGFVTDCIRKAIETDLDFAIEETQRLLVDYLLGDEKRHREHDDYVLVEIICKKLHEEHPRQFFEMMVDCFLHVISVTSTKAVHWYTIDSVFGSYWVRDYPEKLYVWLVESGKKDAMFASSYVIQLLETKSEKAISLAFMLMTCIPSKFDEVIKKIVSDNSKLDDYLEYADFKYYFLELLKAWYSNLEEKEKEWYQERILQFHSYTDFIAEKDRKSERPLYFSLWWRKWQLLYTIGDGKIPDTLNRCKMELCRRFGCDFENNKHSQGVSMAMACSGLVSSEVYRTFSKKAWLHSFYGVKEHRPGRQNEWIPFDPRVHATEFSQCVAANPFDYLDFVNSLFQNERVSDSYRFAGLKGLLKGGCAPKDLLTLFRHFMTETFILQNSTEFFEVSSRFAMVKEMEEDLFQLYRKTILSGVSDYHEEADSIERQVTGLLNHVINTPSGHALEALIDLAAEKELRGRIYKELDSLCDRMNPGMRLLVLYKIYSSTFYEEGLFNSLLDRYLPESGIELLFLRPDLIQRTLYFDAARITAFIERIHKDKRSHVVLAQIYFYGISHLAVKKYCLSHLDDIFVTGDEKAVAKMVEVAYKHIQDADFSSLSKEILIRFADDDRELVRRSYLLHCNDLPVTSFPFFIGISNSWKPAKMHEWHSELEYLLRCCSLYPIDCCRYVYQHNIIGQEEPWRYEDELIKVLIAIYKKLKYDDDREMLDQLMDLFDKLILRGNSTVLSALESFS